MRSFAGQCALVTGAGSGIGRAIALALASRGAQVGLVGRTLASLEAVRAEAGADQARSFPADLTDDDAVRRLVDQAVTAWGRIDLLVHGAGIWRRGEIAGSAVADLDLQWRVNCRGPYLLTQLSLPALKASRGQVVFVNSSAGVVAKATVAGYAMAKHGLKALADALREEVNPLGVRALSVYCGRTATPMQEQVFATEGNPYRPDRLLQPEDIATMVIHALALPRTAEVTDLHIRPAYPPG